MAEARFEMPDGRTGTLRGESLDAIRRKAQEMGATLRQAATPEEPFGSTSRAVAGGMGERLLGNLAGLANVPTKAVNAMTRLAFPDRGDPAEMTGEFERRVPPLMPDRSQAPQIPEINLPTGRQMASAIESPIQAVMAGQSLSDAYESRTGERDRLAEERPGANAVGSVLGDAATLATARAPLMRGPGGLLDDAVSGGVTTLSRALNPQSAPRGLRSLLSRGVDSSGFRSLARGAGRSAEAGLEGAFLGTLQDRDPLELAAAGAGSQVAASVGNSFVDEMIGRPGRRSLKRAAATAAIGTAALQLLKSTAPGGEDEILSTIETNFSKVALGTLLGFTVGLAGRRSSVDPGTFGREFPRLADAMATVPRAGVMNLIEAAREDPTVESAMQNVGGLNESDAKRFNEILESENPGDNLRSWMDSNKRVRNVLTSPDPRLANVPVKEEN